ncbi:MAG: amidase family protein, partial [Rhodospirillales bacterium]|nr:amidase family protein [Rhodospirillales bacterium]
MAKFPTVRTPTIEEVLDIAEGYGMTITVEDAESYRGLMAGTIASYHRLDDLDEPKLPVKYPRSPGYRPPPEENPYNAWYWKSEVKGASRGPLKGKKVALKDNICLAGVPMMNGATVLEGYVPDVDATVVTRILEAGGTIVGKAANTYLCFDGGSATTATGMVENPHKPGHTCGGSSAGSGVLVLTGEADMALGGDQGGS